MPTTTRRPTAPAPSSGGYEVLVTTAPPTPGESHTLSFDAIGKKAGAWTNCAEMTSDVFAGTALAFVPDDTFEDFRRAVLKLPHVLECHLVSGDFDYLVKARINEMASYRKLLLWCA